MLREKFEDRKRISRSHKWKDKQYNYQKKKKQKRHTMLHKILHGEPKIEQPKPYNNPKMYPGAHNDSSFYSTCDTRLVTHVNNLVISHIGKILGNYAQSTYIFFQHNLSELL